MVSPEVANVLSKYGNVLHPLLYPKAVEVERRIIDENYFIENGIMYTLNRVPITNDMRTPGMNTNQRRTNSFDDYLQNVCGVSKEDLWKARGAMGEARTVNLV